MLRQFSVNRTGSGKAARLVRLHLSGWLLLAGMTCFAQDQFGPLPPGPEDDPIKYLLPVEESSIFDATSGTEFSTCFCVESFPEFEGGMKGLNKYLREHLKYPPGAIARGVSGVVYVGFTVQKDGAVANARVLKGIGYGCNEEALRIIKEMPRWKPGTQSGRPVTVNYSLPVRFLQPETTAKERRKRLFPLLFGRTFSR